MATVTVRMDEPVKSQLYHVADQLWISVSSMFNAYAKEVIRRKKVSFSLDDESLEDVEMQANAKNLKAKGRRSVASGRSSLVI